MCDMNWCTFCDNAVSAYSVCSQQSILFCWGWPFYPALFRTRCTAPRNAFEPTHLTTILFWATIMLNCETFHARHRQRWPTHRLPHHLLLLYHPLLHPRHCLLHCHQHPRLRLLLRPPSTSTDHIDCCHRQRSIWTMPLRTIQNRGFQRNCTSSLSKRALLLLYQKQLSSPYTLLSLYLLSLDTQKERKIGNCT